MGEKMETEQYSPLVEREQTFYSETGSGSDTTRKPLLGESCSSGQCEDISVVVNGGPQLHKKPGAWIVYALIFGFEYLHKTASAGIQTNLVVYLSTVLHGSNAWSAAQVTTWNGTSLFTPLLGAIIADIYWGSYKTIFIFSLIDILGLVIITVSAFSVSLYPPLCEGGSCQPASKSQSLAFFFGLYLVAFGMGGVDSGFIPLGADQFDEKKKASFFIWMYVCVTLGSLTSGTVIVWIQEYVSWPLGFGIATSCVVLGFGGLILGRPIYKLRMPSGSPLKSIGQVLVASFRKAVLEVPKDSSLLYEVNGENSESLPRARLAHTDQFRFLDKAAIVFNSDLKDDDPQISWRLCTVTQVEELKVILRLIPIWMTSVLFIVAFSQMSTTFVEQGRAMQTTIGSFSIPPASLSSFKVISALAWILVYNNIVHGDGLSQLQRIGVGHVLIILTMTTAACVEYKRKESTIRTGTPISITWQLPQYFILAGSEIFFIISQSEFFYDQAPDSMKSMCTAFSMLSAAMGQYLSSFVVFLVGILTSMGGRPGWIPDDLNKGHLDYFFWSMTGLCTLNFAAHLAFAKSYIPKSVLFER